MKNLYRVEIFQDNVWIILSRHRNEDFAVINAETTSKCRKCPAKVIHDGKIMWKSEEK